MNCKNRIPRVLGELSDSNSYLPTIKGYVSDILEMKVRLLD